MCNILHLHKTIDKIKLTSGEHSVLNLDLLQRGTGERGPGLLPLLIANHTKHTYIFLLLMDVIKQKHHTTSVGLSYFC